METTELSETIPVFFIVTDNIFLAVFIVEFLLKVYYLNVNSLNSLLLPQVYAEPIGYWKNNYNVFDFTVLIFTVAQFILIALDLGPAGITVLRVVRGIRLIVRSLSIPPSLQLWAHCAPFALSPLAVVCRCWSQLLSTHSEMLFFIFCCFCLFLCSSLPSWAITSLAMTKVETSRTGATLELPCSLSSTLWQWAI